MKKYLFIVFFFFAGNLSSADLVFTRNGSPESTYNDTNGTLSLSSTTVNNIAATTGYRKITIPNVLLSASTFYYRIDGSTLTLTTTGMPVLPASTVEIETNAVISILLEPGSADKTVRYLQRKK